MLSTAGIADRVKRQFGDEAGSQITDADIVRWINDAQRDIALANNLLQIKANTATVAGQADYSLPTDILTLHSVTYKGDKLTGLSLQESNELVGSRQDNSSGTPTHFWRWANSISLYPKPADASAPLVLFYTRRPVEVNSIGTGVFPELPAQYHSRIVEYCLAQAYELDANFEGYQLKMNQFTAGVTSTKDQDEWERDAYPSITVVPEDW